MFNIKKITDISQLTLPNVGYSILYFDSQDVLHILTRVSEEEYVIAEYSKQLVKEQDYLRPIHKIIEESSQINNVEKKKAGYRVFCIEDFSVYELISKSTTDGIQYYWNKNYIGDINGRAQYMDLIGSWILFSNGTYYIVNEDLGHIRDFNNPHKVDKEDIGLGNVENIVQASKEDFDKHNTSYDNPHAVTPKQVKLENIIDIDHAEKVVFDAHEDDKFAHNLTKKQVGLSQVLNIKQVRDEDLKAHDADYDNPHKVTKTDIGLGNIINELQITPAQLAEHVGNARNPHRTTKADIGLGNIINERQISKEAFDAHVAIQTNVHNVSLKQIGLDKVLNFKQIVQATFDAHVANTKAHNVTKNNIGLNNVLNILQATEEEFNEHVNDQLNPHKITLAQIGLEKLVNQPNVPYSELQLHLSARNPHNVTKEQVGLGNIENINHLGEGEYDAHVKDKKAHNLTKAQLGLNNVPNTKQASEEVFNAHVADKSAHNLTKAQLELDNVDNTSDKDKPVSTPQRIEFEKYLTKEPISEYPFIKDGYISSRYLMSDYFSKIDYIGTYDGNVINSQITSINGKTLQAVLDDESAFFESCYLIYDGEKLLEWDDGNLYSKGSYIIKLKNEWKITNNPFSTSSYDVQYSQISYDESQAWKPDFSGQPLKNVIGAFIKRYKEEGVDKVVPEYESESYNAQLTQEAHDVIYDKFKKNEYNDVNDPFIKEKYSIISRLGYTTPYQSVNNMSCISTRHGKHIFYVPNRSMAYMFDDADESLKTVDAGVMSGLCKNLHYLNTSNNNHYVIGIPKDGFNKFVIHDIKNDDFYYSEGEFSGIVQHWWNSGKDTDEVYFVTTSGIYKISSIDDLQFIISNVASFNDSEVDITVCTREFKINETEGHSHILILYDDKNKKIYSFEELHTLSESSEETSTSGDILELVTKDHEDDLLKSLANYITNNPKDNINYIYKYNVNSIKGLICSYDHGRKVLILRQKAIGVVFADENNPNNNTLVSDCIAYYTNVDTAKYPAGCVEVVFTGNKRYRLNLNSNDNFIETLEEETGPDYKPSESIFPYVSITSDGLIRGNLGIANNITKFKGLASGVNYIVKYTQNFDFVEEGVDIFVYNTEGIGFYRSNYNIGLQSLPSNNSLANSLYGFKLKDIVNCDTLTSLYCIGDISDQQIGSYDTTYGHHSGYIKFPIGDSSVNLIKYEKIEQNIFYNVKSKYDTLVVDKFIDEDTHICGKYNADIFDLFDITFIKREDSSFETVKEFIINSENSIQLKSDYKLYINHSLIKFDKNEGESEESIWDTYKVIDFIIHPNNEIIAFAKKKDVENYVIVGIPFNLSEYNSSTYSAEKQIDTEVRIIAETNFSSTLVPQPSTETSFKFYPKIAYYDKNKILVVINAFIDNNPKMYYYFVDLSTGSIVSRNTVGIEDMCNTQFCYANDKIIFGYNHSSTPYGYVIKDKNITEIINYTDSDRGFLLIDAINDSKIRNSRINFIKETPNGFLVSADSCFYYFKYNQDRKELSKEYRYLNNSYMFGYRCYKPLNLVKS